MLVYNVMTAEYVPWLASAWEWSDDALKLTFTTRDGVMWSDGEPFTAKDVAFTFGLMKDYAEFDNFSVWPNLTEVKAIDDQHVEFTFNKPFTPSFKDIGEQPIVPEHIWKDVEDPVQFTNDSPVATGPFTEVVKFENQIYELGRNSNYWQKCAPYIEGMRFPAYNSNEQANLALINGEIDWAGNFVPDADNTYVSKGEGNNYWFPPVGGTVFLYVNTQKAPFDNPDVRKAISMALDRKQIVKVAMYDYTHPSDATGLSDSMNALKDAAVVESGTWTQQDIAKANELLDAAGLKKGADGIRTLPDGTPLKYDLNVVSGWNDWVATCEIMSRNLKEIGIDAPVKTNEFSAWFDMVKRGQFDMSIGWSNSVPFAFNVYRELMSSETVKPIGEDSAWNWHRYGNEEADELFTKLAASTDPAEQKSLVVDLEKIFVENAPAIPLFPGPSWGEYNESRITNWPTADNPYAKLTPNDAPGNLLVMTVIKPK
jgi:peptide/nickel transport system substrate-binding protein